MTQNLPTKMAPNTSTEEWEGISVKGENKESFGGYAGQEVEKGAPRVREHMSAHHLQREGLSPIDNEPRVWFPESKFDTLAA
jgi:NaMN:DMB phosphoribosyltransferase